MQLTQLQANLEKDQINREHGSQFCLPLENGRLIGEVNRICKEMNRKYTILIHNLLLSGMNDIIRGVSRKFFRFLCLFSESLVLFWGLS